MIYRNIPYVQMYDSDLQGTPVPETEQRGGNKVPGLYSGTYLVHKFFLNKLHFKKGMVVFCFWGWVVSRVHGMR